MTNISIHRKAPSTENDPVSSVGGANDEESGSKRVCDSGSLLAKLCS